MTYLSRLELDRMKIPVARDLADAAQLHKTVMRAFPEADGPSPRAEFGVLFRLEASPWQAVVLVQSRIEPDWEKLPLGYAIETEVKSMDPLVARLVAGSTLRFRLLANPTRKVADEGRKPKSGYNSKRRAILDEEGQRGWLERRGESSGFRLRASDDLKVLPRPALGRGGAGRPGLHVRPVLYEGFLEVTDSEALSVAIRAGIGPAKAYGCGMLSVSDR